MTSPVPVEIDHLPTESGAVFPAQFEAQHDLFGSVSDLVSDGHGPEAQEGLRVVPFWCGGSGAAPHRSALPDDPIRTPRPAKICPLCSRHSISHLFHPISR